MDPKLLAEVLGLKHDATEDQILDGIREIKKAAEAGVTWKVRAEDMLGKAEASQALIQENKDLKAEAYVNQYVMKYRITTAEAAEFKKMILAGQEDSVKNLIELRADQEYLTRVQSLQNVKEVPVSPLAELDGRAAELMSKEKITKVDARKRVLAEDPDLQARYDAVYVAGRGGNQ